MGRCGRPRATPASAPCLHHAGETAGIDALAPTRRDVAPSRHLLIPQAAANGALSRHGRTTQFAPARVTVRFGQGIKAHGRLGRAMLTRLRRRGVGRDGPGLATEAALADAAQHRTPRPGDAFTPTRPQRSARRFVGRRAEFEKIRQALEEDHAHVAIYGARGRGKTSLANLVVEAMRANGHMVARHICASSSDFDEIMRGLARDLPRQFLAVPASVPSGGEAAPEGAEAALPAGALSARDVTALPARLAGHHLVLVVDEFDRIPDERTRIRVAEAMKQASDRGTPLSMVLIGVADSAEELLGGHPLLRRNLVRVPLPLLADAEVEEIVAAGAEDCGVGFPPAARMVIARISRGVPHVAHLLALRAAQAAIARDAHAVGRGDLWAAVDRLIEDSDAATTGQYETLTRRDQDRAAVTLLQRIAAAPQDAFGRFALDEPPGSGPVRVGDVGVPPADWRALVAAKAFRLGPGWAAFMNPELQTYLLLRAASGFAATRRITAPGGTLP